MNTHSLAHSLDRLRLRYLLAAACLLSDGAPLRGQSPIVLEARLSAKDVTGKDVLLGSPAALSGDTLVIPGVVHQGDRTATSYVFVREGTMWTQQARLAGDAGDGYGWSVAVSRDTIVVGAPFEDSNATGVNGNANNDSASDSGAAYVFERENTLFGLMWVQKAYLKASNTRANSNFGSMVAISGNTIVVGASQDSIRGAGAGAAYVFVRGAEGWTEEAILYASNADSGDWFGETLAISGDTIVVGAEYESSSATGVNGNENNNGARGAGAAYVFERQSSLFGTRWVQQAYLKASNTQMYDYFGAAVAISGDTIAVGAANDDSNAAGVNGDQGNFGSDGLFNAGAVYVFGRSGTTWTQQAYLKSDSPNASDGFGMSVATTGDMVMACSGNTSTGRIEVHLFVRQEQAWSPLAFIGENPRGLPSFNVWALAASGNTMVVSPSVFTIVRSPTLPPSLTMAPSAAGIRLSWPSSSEDWLLEHSETMEPAKWNPIPAPYESDTAGFYHAVENPPRRGFFRLRQQ